MWEHVGWHTKGTCRETKVQKWRAVSFLCGKYIPFSPLLSNSEHAVQNKLPSLCSSVSGQLHPCLFFTQARFILAASPTNAALSLNLFCQGSFPHQCDSGSPLWRNYLSSYAQIEINVITHLFAYAHVPVLPLLP